jgi:hypothetical protein
MHFYVEPSHVVCKLVGAYRAARPGGLACLDTYHVHITLSGPGGIVPSLSYIVSGGMSLMIHRCAGIGEGRVFIASETSAFNRYTKNFIAMKDGEIGVVRADGSSLDLSRVQKAPHVDILLSPDPYPHWTIRECLEQPEAIARALAFGGRMSESRVFLGGLDRQKERWVVAQGTCACRLVRFIRDSSSYDEENDVKVLVVS